MPVGPLGTFEKFLEMKLDLNSLTLSEVQKVGMTIMESIDQNELNEFNHSSQIFIPLPP